MNMQTDEEKQAKWLAALHKQGLGVSDVQESLVTVLLRMDSPLSADEIWEAVQGIRPETGRATVYRFVDKLIAAGLLRRVHGYRNCRTYIPAMNTHQALLICMACGQVNYLDTGQCASVAQVVETTAQQLSSYHVSGYQLQLFGTCIDCQTDET